MKLPIREEQESKAGSDMIRLELSVCVTVVRAVNGPR